MLALVDFSTSNHSNQWNSIEKSSSNTEGNAIRPLPCTRGVIKHGRDRNSFSSVYERGSQARKESQFVLFRIREGFSSTEGITNRSLSYPRGALKHGRDHKPFSFVSEKDSQPGKYFSSVHGFRPTHCFTRHTKSIVFPRYSPLKLRQSTSFYILSTKIRIEIY